MAQRAHLPSPNVASFAKGRMDRFRRVTAVLERFDGEAWTPIARFGSVHAADVALDEAVATGVPPDHLRVTEVGQSMGVRVAMILGYAALALLAGLVLYFLFVG